MVPTTWFETRGVAALLTMRTHMTLTKASDLILRSPPQVGVSKDGYETKV